MSSDVIPGAAFLWPAQLGGAGVVHLARAEARRKGGYALLGVCPDLEGVELERAGPRRLLRRAKWCPDCTAYREYLRRRGEV